MAWEALDCSDGTLSIEEILKRAVVEVAADGSITFGAISE